MAAEVKSSGPKANMPDAEGAGAISKSASLSSLSTIQLQFKATQPKFDKRVFDERLRTMHIIILFVAIVFPNMVMVGSFSSMLYGLDNYNRVASRSMQGDALLFLSFATVVVLFIFDWWRTPRCCRAVLGSFPVFFFLAGAVFKGRKYPWAPMLVTLLFMPLGIGLVRKRYCAEVKRHKFYGAVSSITVYVAICIGLLWAYYVMAPPTYKWNQETKDKLAHYSTEVYKYVYAKRPLVYDEDCGPNKNETMLNALTRDEKSDISTACSQASTIWFLSYACPFIAIGCDFIIAVFCKVTGHIGRNEDISRLQKLLTKFVLMVGFCLTGMYACATISSSSIRLGSTLMAFFMAALALLILWTMTEVDMDKLADAAAHSQLMQQLVGVIHSDWTKAMGIGAMGGPLLFFFAVNAVTNSVRHVKGSEGGVGHDYLTPFGREVLTTLQAWDWSGILLKIVFLGEAFFTLQVGVSKVTYIFLSWLNTTLSPTPLEIVVVLVFLIGASMFLLPPVPGLPVYIFAGILLGAKGTQTPAVGFWGGIAIASFLSLFTKLCACVGQYMIGYFLGRSVKVQQLIGVDKVPTRAIEKVLKTRGLNAGKVALLVGGPDWPTSVTCGIIGVNIPQMLLGTIPVMTLLVPCILAGACMGKVKPGEESVWSLAANISTISAATVNMASMAYAIYTVSQTIAKHGDELAKPRPEHEAVAAMTKAEEGAVAAYKQVVNWSNLSKFLRVLLVITALGMYFSNVMFVVLAERCFRTFALSSKIDDSYEDTGLEGKASNIVLYPVGYGALAMFFFALVLHIFFSKVMKCKTSAFLKKQKKQEAENQAQ